MKLEYIYWVHYDWNVPHWWWFTGAKTSWNSKGGRGVVKAPIASVLRLSAIATLRNVLKVTACTTPTYCVLTQHQRMCQLPQQNVPYNYKIHTLIMQRRLGWKCLSGSCLSVWTVVKVGSPCLTLWYKPEAVLTQFCDSINRSAGIIFCTRCVFCSPLVSPMVCTFCVPSAHCVMVLASLYLTHLSYHKRLDLNQPTFRTTLLLSHYLNPEHEDTTFLRKVSTCHITVIRKQ